MLISFFHSTIEIADEASRINCVKFEQMSSFNAPQITLFQNLVTYLPIRSLLGIFKRKMDDGEAPDKNFRGKVMSIVEKKKNFKKTMILTRTTVILQIENISLD